MKVWSWNEMGELQRLAEDVHGTLASLAFTDSPRDKKTRKELRKYFLNEYKIKIVGIGKKRDIPYGIIYLGKNKKFSNEINDEYFDDKIITPLCKILLTNSKEIREEAEELFYEVNDYLNPEF